jgi:hypothetical protein
MPIKYRYGNKERKACRGPKLRYSLWKAQHNERWELIHKRMVENICKTNNLDIRYHIVQPDDRHSWQLTWMKLREEGYYGSRSIRDQQAEVTKEYNDGEQQLS